MAEIMTKTEQELLIQDLAMLIRRLVRKHPNARLVAQARGFLKRRGLEGNVLRTAQDNIGNGELNDGLIFGPR